MLPLVACALTALLPLSIAQGLQGPPAPPTPETIARYTACIAQAVSGNSSQFVVPTSPNYASELDIYNLDNVVTPSAIAFPNSAEEVAALVKCAADAKIAVQPLSGGHSFDNFGMCCEARGCDHSANNCCRSGRIEWLIVYQLAELERSLLQRCRPDPLLRHR